MKRLKPSSPSSVFEPRLLAAITPIQAPIRVASSVPVPTSSSVHGSAAQISLADRLARALADAEVERHRVAGVVGELARGSACRGRSRSAARRAPRSRRWAASRAGGRVAHHPEEEEVEDQDEDQRHHRGADLAAPSHLPRVIRLIASNSSGSSARRPRAPRRRNSRPASSSAIAPKMTASTAPGAGVLASRSRRRRPAGCEAQDRLVGDLLADQVAGPRPGRPA